MEKELLLPPSVFPSVAWFLAGAAKGKFNVAIGGNYEKQTSQNRYHIAGPNGLQKLVMPIEHTGAKKSLAEARISRSEKWAKEHMNAMKSAYGKSPFFEFYDYKIFPLLQNEDLRLAQLIECSIRLLHGFFLQDMALVFTDTFNSNIEFPTVSAYPQVFENKFGFRANVSALDLLFNMGPQAGDYLQGKFTLSSG